MTLLTTRPPKTPQQKVIESLLQPDEVPTTRLTLDVPVTLHTELKLRAATEGNTMRHLAIKALNEYLSKTINLQNQI